MDAKGLKMSKSLGNTVNPLDLMKEHGADILRLWALSVDFTEDHRIGKEILAGVADQYRKLRNTFRYLLGALADFSEEEKVGIDAMPELELYMLHLVAELDKKLRQAVNDFDFNSYTRLLSDFANNDLSAFYFDIRKDVLYCEVNAETGFQTDKRRAYRTVLDELFQGLVRWLAPVLVFTTEEVWGTRYPERGIGAPRRMARDPGRSSRRRPLGQAPRASDPGHRGDRAAPRDKVIGSSLQAVVTVPGLSASPDELAELFIVSSVKGGDALRVEETENHKCGRCWRYLPEVKEDGELCARCEGVLNA
jgi:isoleucyl-tRNA synthetase